MSTETWAVAAPQTIEVEGVTGVDVRLQGGRAEVVADAAATVTRIDVLEVSDKPLQVVRDGDRLRVGYESSWFDSVVARVKSPRRSERAVVRLVVPPDAAVDVGTVDADVEVSGGRKVAVRTVTGTIRTAGTTGPMSVRTVSGEVAVTDHTGDASASVVSGRLALDGALGRVSLTSVSGAATVAPTTSPMITAKTVSGALDLRLLPGTPVNVKVRGASGQVVLDGSVLPSSGATLVVDHAEQPAEGRSAAYLSATVTSAHVTVDRR
ncbi:hypothetical protein GCM10009809_02530 [Isoptericola hypogeus]|uniref:Adhesin n=1 Tax=Isoptericola hypogeus TaxID=300179 RepID=A0ABN2IQD5_9MICO